MILRVRALTSHTRRQVRQLLIGVLKRVKLGVFFNLEIRSIFRRVFKSNGAFDIDMRARYIKIEERDAVAEYVMNPPKASGLRRDRQIRMQKPLIEAVARTKHQPMLSEADWPLVPVLRQVSNDKNGHAPGSTKIS